jgi:hypothetical protein
MLALAAAVIIVAGISIGLLVTGGTPAATYAVALHSGTGLSASSAWSWPGSPCSPSSSSRAGSTGVGGHAQHRPDPSARLERTGLRGYSSTER